jgi:hypothetical protein
MGLVENSMPFLPPFQPSNLAACKIPALCNALLRNTALEMFVCQYNMIRDEGAVAVAHVLNAWTAIRQFDL